MDANITERYMCNGESIETARAAAPELIPKSSRERYEKMYKMFKSWQAANKSTGISQTVLLTFLHEMAQKHKPSTLWAYYSMLKTTMKANDRLDIGRYAQLLAFLKSTASGYLPIKASVFTLADIHKFIESWLDVKVVCIFAVSGACSSHELPKIQIKDVENHGDVLLVKILKSPKSKGDRSFTITGTFREMVQKYAALRRPGMEEQRFFVNYQRGKCRNQVIGKNKFASMPRRMARYLNLPEPDTFTGQSFRKTSLSFQKSSGTILINGFNKTNESMPSKLVELNAMPLGSAVAAQTANDPLNGSTVDYPNAVPVTSSMSYAKGPKRKFGEIYCNEMGELTYQCSICSEEMDHSDEFSLHYMSHFRDVFETVKLGPQRGPTVPESEYLISEPISTIKLEETQIKSEPLDYEGDG